MPASRKEICYGLIPVILLTGWIFRSAWLPEEGPVQPVIKIRSVPTAPGTEFHLGNPLSSDGKSPLPGDDSSTAELEAIVQKIRLNKGSMDEAMKNSLNRLAQTDPMQVIEALAPILQAFPEKWGNWLAMAVIIQRAGTNLTEDQWPVWLEKLKSYPLKKQDELLSLIAQALAPARGQEAYDLSMRIQDETEAAIAGGEVLSRWIQDQPGKALELVDQVLAFGPGSRQMQRFADGWAAGDFPGFLLWVQHGDNADIAPHFAGIVARNALMVQDYEMAASHAWTMEEDEFNSREDLLETLRSDPKARPALVKLGIPLEEPPGNPAKP